MTYNAKVRVRNLLLRDKRDVYVEIQVGSKFHMKKPVVKIISYFLLISLLSGCLGGREVNDLEIVIGMGLDSTENPDSILLTAQVVDVSQLGLSGGSGKDSKAYWNVSTSASTIFEAIRQVTHKTGNRLFVSHCKIFVYGRELAEEGLYKHFDFVLRAMEMRLTTLILIADDKASDVLDAKPQTEELPAMNIDKLVKSYGYTSHLYAMTLKDFASRLISKTKSPMAPIIRVIEEGDEKDIYITGLAIFNGDKMVGELNMDETRGLLWVINEVESGVLLVPTPEGTGTAVFEIGSAKGKVKPEITEDGRVIMHIDIKLNASLSEQTSTEKLADPQKFEILQDGMSEVVTQEIMAAYEKSVKTSSDIFGFGDLVQKRYKKRWDEYKDIWDEVYKTIELDINVKSKITKADLLNNPVAYKARVE
jgi:Ger(x)C family germination protein